MALWYVQILTVEGTVVIPNPERQMGPCYILNFFKRDLLVFLSKKIMRFELCNEVTIRLVKH